MKKILLSGMALALLVVACSEEGVTPPPPRPPNPITDILRAIEWSFNGKDIRYLENNVTEGFVFHFDPDDVGQNPPVGNYVIPTSWSRTEFLQAAENLLERAYSIALYIPTYGVGEPGPNENSYEVEDISIKLLVMPEEKKMYLADYGYCDFRFERFENDGERVWHLTDWWDYTAATLGNRPTVAPPSLGQLVALYY